MEIVNFEDADFNQIIDEFLNHYLIDEEIEIYNEISFQIELGLFLRNKFPNEKIEFERNVKKLGLTIPLKKNLEEAMKKEIDIYLYHKKDKKKRFAIEVKFPLNGETPEEMYQFVLDIKFMQMLKDMGFSKTYTVVLAIDKTYHTGSHQGRNIDDYIFKYFRYFPTKGEVLTGKIYKPTGQYKGKKYIDLKDKIYKINWLPWYNHTANTNSKYYIVSIDK